MGEHLLKPLAERIDSCISRNSCNDEETPLLRAALKTMCVKACRYDEIQASNPELVSTILEDDQPLENTECHTEGSDNVNQHREGNNQMSVEETISLVGDSKSPNKSWKEASTSTDDNWQTQSNDDVGCKVMIINSSDGLDFSSHHRPDSLSTELYTTPCSEVESDVSSEENKAKQRLIFRDSEENPVISYRTAMHTIPPITINSTIKCTELKETICSILGHDDFDLKVLTDDCLELQVHTDENFRLIQSEFAKSKMQFHPNVLVAKSFCKYLIKGIPATFSVEHVKQMLEECGYTVDKVMRLHNRYKRPMKIVLIDLSEVGNNKEILNLKRIGDYDVEVSRFRVYRELLGHPYNCYPLLCVGKLNWSGNA